MEMVKIKNGYDHGRGLARKLHMEAGEIGIEERSVVSALKDGTELSLLGSKGMRS